MLIAVRLRQRREVPTADIEMPDVELGPEAVLEEHVMREWLWQALERLSPEERVTVLLRHFTRCTGYAEIAQVTWVPVGWVPAGGVVYPASGDPILGTPRVPLSPLPPTEL